VLAASWVSRDREHNVNVRGVSSVLALAQYLRSNIPFLTLFSIHRIVPSRVFLLYRIFPLVKRHHLCRFGRLPRGNASLLDSVSLSRTKQYVLLQWLHFHGRAMLTLECIDLVSDRLELTTGAIWAGLCIDYPYHSFSHLGVYFGAYEEFRIASPENLPADLIP
jgi:hypothetical protein